MMNCSLRVFFASSLVAFVMINTKTSLAQVDETFFETRIRPVLVSRCFECHGRDNPKSGLRVDSREALLKGGESGPAIVSGNSDSSLLVQAISYSDENLQMPPKARLSEEIVHDFVSWIKAGAPWPAFKPVTTKRVVTLPQVSPKKPDDQDIKTALQLWLKSDNQSWQNGQSVQLWEDSSGRGHDLVATAGARSRGTGGPATYVSRSNISGFPAVRFDPQSGLGGNAATAPNITGDAEFTLFAVLQMSDNSNRQTGFFAGFGEPASAANPGLARAACLECPLAQEHRWSLIGGWGHNASTQSTTAAKMDGQPIIVAATKHRGPFSTTSHIAINGTDGGPLNGHDQIPDFAQREDLGFFVGRAQAWGLGFSGDVAEVILFNTALPADIRQGIESYLSAKYRIPLGSASQVQVVSEGDPAFSLNHWAFDPVRKVDPPGSAVLADGAAEAAQNRRFDESRSNHPIDQFVSAKWTSLNLKPVSTADPRTLVRRLYFDLIGLPPTAAEMEAAVAALTPWSEAHWSALIDRLLESPQYGERWGRYWLDVVRYADTAGDNADYPVPESRFYRDYVIDSFNADKPFDQFVREQLAGDLLAADGPRERYAEQIVATGFLAISRRYATGPYELWHLTLEDTIDTVGQAFMGITLRCARCHDHKFDPVTQRDYYALYGIFESTQFPWAGGEEFQSQKVPRQHFVPMIPPREVEPLLDAQSVIERQLEKNVAEFERESSLVSSLAVLAEKLSALKSASAPPNEVATAQSEHDKLKKQVDAKRAEILAPKESARRRGFPDTVPVAYAVSEGDTRSTFLQRSGDPGQPGPVVARGVPSFLPSLEHVAIPTSASGRLQFAQWLTRPDHPLTGRVFVNRIWQHHFGRGLVPTPSNFGTRGVSPTHPELLDWLTQSFIELGWRVKPMHRLILTSRVWRLASTDDPENTARDPDNAYLWQHERRRLDAEAIRDSLLATSGRLDLNRPNEHPFPPILKWNFTQHSQFKDFYPSFHRSVYLMTPRLQRHPYLALFDGPDTNTTTGSRTSSIVPAQALYLMNGQEIKDEAESFAKRILGTSPEVRVVTAFQLAYQRPPTREEADKSDEFLAAYIRLADEMTAWTALCRSLLTAHEFVYIE